MENKKAEIQELQKKFFREYRDQCLSNPENIERDLNRWESVKDTILTMSLNEQSEYADYIVKKMCQQPEDLFNIYAKETFEEIKKIENLEEISSHVIGNMALIVKTLPEGEFQKEIKLKFDLYIDAFQ